MSVAPDPFSQMSHTSDAAAEAPPPDEESVDPVVNAVVEELGAALALRPPQRAPRATYRIQFAPAFDFRDAARIVPYLASLGVSTIYASPVFAARPGSTHGYDVTDYGQLNEELGGEEGFAELRRALTDVGMALLLDFVPNHMGIGSGTNGWWLSVLEHGRGSPYGTYFDIDWEPIAPDMRGRVLLPILGDQYGAILEAGELRVRFDADAGAFRLAYYDDVLPVAPDAYPLILRQTLAPLLVEVPADDLDVLELQSVITSLERLPDRNLSEPEAIEERQRETLIAKRRLADLVARSPEIGAAITEAAGQINGDADDPQSFDLLDRLLEAQVYRLAYWRVAAEEINYRRFFAINDLASIRQEDSAVFAASHALLLRLLAEGDAQGVRIDHIDGLLDPAAYTRSVQRGELLEAGRAHYATMDVEREAGEERPEWEAVAPSLSAWLDAAGPDDASLVKPVYLLVEKILEHGEDLPAGWPVDGTTGYEFANAATGLFVDGGSRRAFDELYAAFIGVRRVRFDDIVYDAKRMILREALASELAVLVNQLDHISAENRRSRDFTPQSLRVGLREVIAGFPVYRSYVAWDAETATPVVHDTDRAAVEAAVKNAIRRNPGVDRSVFAFIRDVMLVEVPGATDEQRSHHGWFAVKVQQLSGPVMAKGLEDTAFFRYLRLVALNEVGGDPSSFGTTVAAFHAANRARLTRFPDAMVASSTHDTKRSEDVRARLATLSELPREWRAAVNRWARFNRRFKTRVEGEPAPDRNDEYGIYQTVLGAWPFDAEIEGDPMIWPSFVDRVVENTIKATREASVHTSWIAPTEYETATEAFIRAILDPDRDGNRFLADAQALRGIVSTVGMANGLAQQVLKLTVPGVPDIYQGTERWDLSLTDPDNRRPVDFVAHAATDIAAAPTTAHADELVAVAADGAIKQVTTALTLRFRADHEALFRRGRYESLEADGPHAGNVVAFARRSADASDGEEALVIVPRLVHGLTRPDPALPIGAVWAGSALLLPGVPAGSQYRNVYTGEEVVTEGPGEGAGSSLPLAKVFAHFPVALLERASAGASGVPHAHR